MPPYSFYNQKAKFSKKLAREGEGEGGGGEEGGEKLFLEPPWILPLPFHNLFMTY